MYETTERPVRKRTRLQAFDYNTPGYYFITVCTLDKAKVFGDIVGHGLPDVPQMQYTALGKTVLQQLDNMKTFYKDILLEKFVVMPNHIHLLLYIPGHFPVESCESKCNSKISKFVGTLKRFTNRQAGKNLWQTSFHDHIIRCDADYQKIWQYIEENPSRWEKDCFY